MFSRRRREKLRDFSAKHVIYAVLTSDWMGELGKCQSNHTFYNSDVTVDLPVVEAGLYHVYQKRVTAL